MSKYRIIKLNLMYNEIETNEIEIKIVEKGKDKTI